MLLLLAALCGVVEAVFTALEVALSAVSRAHLRALAEPEHPRAEEEEAAPSPQTVRRARQTLALLEHPERLSVLFLCVTSLSLWSAASLLTWGWLSGAYDWPILVALGVALLFIAEVVPLLLAAPRAEAFALGGAPFVALALRVLFPLTWPLSAFSYALARLLGSGPRPRPHVTEGELRTALASAEEEGVIEPGERALIEGAMDLRTQSVREVMTPRLDMVGVEAGATLPDALRVALREGHSRLPVYEGTLDKIVGVLATKDLLPHLCPTEQGAALKTARDVVRPVLFVPEIGRVSAVLDELRRNRTLLAMVVDVNGAVSGLVTLEDLLEELVGEIQDEYDAEEAPVRFLHPHPQSQGVESLLVCDASSSVRELGRFFGAELGMTTTLRDASGAPVGSGITLAALALECFGRVPAVGDKIEVGSAFSNAGEERTQWQVWFEVAQMDGPRLLELLAFLKEAEEEN